MTNKRKYDRAKEKRRCAEYLSTPRGNISTRIRTGRYLAKKRGHAPPNVTIDQVLAALKAQNHSCASCSESFIQNGEEVYCIDHSHKTGEFRALLCNDCNTVEGYAKTPERCELVADYMRRCEPTDTDGTGL